MLGVPTDDPAFDPEALAVVNAQLRRLVELQSERIGELEKLLEELRRGGKRQADPFSKGITEAKPKRPGRTWPPRTGGR